MFARRPSVLLFALVWISAAWFGSWPWNPNNAVRMFAAISIVEEGDATIDQFEHLTIDKARFGPHFYLDKAPGMTLAAVPIVAAVDGGTGDRVAGKTLSFGDQGLDTFLKLREWWVAALVNGTLLALAAVALMDIGRRTTGSLAAGAFGAIAFALGTPLWGWATTLFGHAAVASLLVIAARQVLKGTSEDRGRWDAVWAGLALGWALVVEHSALLFAAPVGLWALWRLRALPRQEVVRSVSLAVAAGVAAMVPMLAYNLFAFGDPFRLGYQGVVGWSGMDQGLFGLTHPRMAVLWQILFGAKRGMIWVAPVLMVAPVGVVMLWLRGWRDLAVLAAAGAVTAFLYNASYAYWDGGNSTGPRHAMPAVAFLGLALPMLWARANVIGRAALAVVLASSVGINLTIAAAEITAPWSAPNGLVDGVWRDRFLPGYLRTIPNEWFGIDPWVGLAIWAAIATLLFGALCLSLTRHGWRANI